MASIKFDGTELVNATYVTRRARHEDAPERMLDTVAVPARDGVLVVSERRDSKVIVVEGTLIGTSSDDLEAKIDAMKELFARQAKDLDILWNATTRRYVATCTRHEFDRDHFNIRFVPWKAWFLVPEGVGYTQGAGGTLESAYANSLLTVTTEQDVVMTVAKGSTAPHPMIRATVAGLSLSSSRGFMLKNLDTGEKIIVPIDASWDIGEYVLIDCLLRTVKATVASLAAVDVPFFGVFPTFALGANNFRIQKHDIPIQELAVVNATDFTNGWSTSSTNRRICQSFEVPYADTTFRSLALVVTKAGSPGTSEFRIETDAGGKPSGTLADAAATVTTTPSATTTQAWKLITFAAKFALAGRTKYWLVVKPTGTNDGSNNLTFWFAQAGSPAAYPKGNVAISSDGGSTFTAYPDDDLAFRVNLGGSSETAQLQVAVDYNPEWL